LNNVKGELESASSEVEKVTVQSRIDQAENTLSQREKELRSCSSCLNIGESYKKALSSLDLAISLVTTSIGRENLKAKPSSLEIDKLLKVLDALKKIKYTIERESNHQALSEHIASFVHFIAKFRI
jgi:Xaa-Pro aminopeptidase